MRDPARIGPATDGETMICGLNQLDPGSCHHPARGRMGEQGFDPLCADHALLAQHRAFGKYRQAQRVADRLRQAGCVVPKQRPELPGVKQEGRWP